MSRTNNCVPGPSIVSKNQGGLGLRRALPVGAGSVVMVGNGECASLLREPSRGERVTREQP
jgi:hypothetical protein